MMQNLETQMNRRPQPNEINCASPVDSQYFDDAQIVALPAPGESAIVARYVLPPQYCGVLERFAQFTNLHARQRSAIETPGLQWQILSNRQPVFPYHDFAILLNPWGFQSLPVSIHLPSGTTIEFRVTNRGNNKGLTRVGGRLLGRFWFSSAYGGAQ